jgi:glucosyl-3-phosphoglycerate synthase
MSDFFQPGIISTLHRLTSGGLERLEVDLTRFNRANPIGLVLPALYREFEMPAMANIVEELRSVTYFRRIVCAIGDATREQYEHARTFFEGFQVPVTPLWLEDPRMLEILALLKKNEVDPGGPGKGRACWLAFGSLFVDDDIEVIALHDCDIQNYTRELAARLVWPVAHPNLGMEFCKGFYARVSDRLHGRVTRLFFTPLVRAIQGMTPELPYLRFLDSFRYALAGEFAMKADLARAIRIPSHWGLEVGVLSEIFRNVSPLRVCQVDLTDNYEHKHQDLSAGDPEKGLRRMSRDIATSLFRSIAQEGVVLGADHLRSLQVYYIRFAQDTIRRYHADALINGLKFDRHSEDGAVGVFAQSLRDAADAYMQDPLGAPQIPNWNRVAAAIPDIFERLQAVNDDLEILPGKKKTVAVPRSSQAAPAGA